jgi:hypothetical protein
LGLRPDCVQAPKALAPTWCALLPGDPHQAEQVNVTN